MDSSHRSRFAIVCLPMPGSLASVALLIRLDVSDNNPNRVDTQPTVPRRSGPTIRHESQSTRTFDLRALLFVWAAAAGCDPLLDERTSLCSSRQRAVGWWSRCC